MDINISFYNLIKSVCDGRVYPDHVPLENAQWPAVRYIQIWGSAINTNCYSVYTYRMQVDIYANTVNERVQIERKIQNLLASSDQLDCTPKAAAIHSFDFKRVDILPALKDGDSYCG